MRAFSLAGLALLVACDTALGITNGENLWILYRFGHLVREVQA